MESIWSKNKYINMIINVLLFLMATNFLHFGYLLLPIVCLLLFVDNEFKFKINNIKIFILLCLFGLTFLMFSYKLGFYCLFGFFLPMSYFVGSNIKEINEENIKKILFLLIFGMGVHVVLNFGYELATFGIETFVKVSHFDFWTHDKVSTTQTATNYVFMLSVLYYVLIYEKNRNIKISYFILFVLMMIYELAIARRTPILLIIGGFILSLIVDIAFVKNKDRKVRNISIIFIGLCIVAIIVSIIYIASVYNHEWYFDENVPTLFRKFYFFGVGTSRIDIFIEALKIAPQHLWGGQEITTLFDINVHDLWMDTFDYAGIVPYILLIVYSIYCFIKMIFVLKNNDLSKSFRLLIFILFICIAIQMFLEPIITGSPIFLLCSMLIIASIERLNSK